ncbi:MAG: DUF2149 domain-containing protein [Gemmataceae bacterium]
MFARAAADLGMTAEFVTTEDTGKVTTDQLAAAEVAFLLNLQPQGAAIVSQQGREVETLRMTDSKLTGEGERLGTAYRLKSDKVVYVPEARKK